MSEKRGHMNDQERVAKIWDDLCAVGVSIDSLRHVRAMTEYLKAALAAVREAEREACEVDFMTSVIEEIYYDRHSAGMLPGAGYNYRAYRMVGDKFDWRDTTPFKKWISAIRARSEAKP